MISELSFSPHTGQSEPDLREDRVLLQGEVTWVLEGPAETLAVVRHHLPRGVAKPVGGSLLLDFGNLVGSFAIPEVGAVEIVSGKWSRTDYERMLAELTRALAALPFAAGDVARIPFDQRIRHHEDVLYHAFAYLRHVLSDQAPREVRLLPSLEAIVREPHYRMRQTRRRRDLALAGRTDSVYLVRLAAGCEPLTRTPPAYSALPLARALRGHLPDEVDEVRAERSFDTAENRFTRHFLELCDGVLDRVHALARHRSKEGSLWRSVAEQCRSMRKRLGLYVASPLWDSVGRMTQLPAGSTVLHRRRGYREVFRHYLRLRATPEIPLDVARLFDWLEAKDIAELYELWCYYRLTELVTKELGARPLRASRHRVDDTKIGPAYDFRVTWPGAVTCSYNLRFSRSRGPGRRSYSVPLRPDIVLDVPAGPSRGLHVLDAKFRLQRKSGAGRDSADLEPDPASYLHQDLHKMHAYRDALLPVRSAWVLYPGTHERFFGLAGSAPESLDQLPSPVEGVGAVPFSPGDEERARAVVRQLLAGAAG